MRNRRALSSKGDVMQTPRWLQNVDDDAPIFHKMPYHQVLQDCAREGPTAEQEASLLPAVQPDLLREAIAAHVDGRLRAPPSMRWSKDVSRCLQEADRRADLWNDATCIETAKPILGAPSGLGLGVVDVGLDPFLSLRFVEWPPFAAEFKCSGCQSSTVILHVYDYHRITKLTRLPIFHVGIEVYGLEFCFGGGGVEHCTPGVLSRPDLSYLHRQALPLGPTTLGVEAVRSILLQMRKDWPGCGYTIFGRNCQTFVVEFGYRLGVGDRIPAEYVQYAGTGHGGTDCAMIESPCRENADIDGRSSLTPASAPLDEVKPQDEEEGPIGVGVHVFDRDCSVRSIV